MRVPGTTRSFACDTHAGTGASLCAILVVHSGVLLRLTFTSGSEDDHPEAICRSLERVMSSTTNACLGSYLDFLELAEHTVNVP